MASIEWDKVPGGQPRFDEVVEAFFVREYADESGETYAVNGRGGDGGIDIHLRHDGKLIIVQLKFFPEGLSGGFRDVRQKEIRRSFRSALNHSPDEWWLVVPSTLTVNERKWALGLPGREKPPRTGPKVHIFDRPQLDALAAKHLDLVTYFDRDDLREAAMVYSQERALIVDQADLVARVAALAKQSDTLDPDWRLGFFTDGEIVGTVLIAKHPLAAERSPINITMGAKFTTGQDELRRRFDRVIGFGTPERLDLPAAVIRNFDVSGPDFIKQSGEDVEVTIMPVESDSAGKPFAMEMHNENGKVTARYAGKTLWTGRAHLGASAKAEFYNVSTLEFLLPYDRAAGVSVTARVNLAGREPADIVRAVGMLERIDSEHGAKLVFDGDYAASLLLDGQGKSVFGQYRDDILLHKDVAADLVYVQDQTHQYFAYPAEVSVADRIYLRVLRRLLEGRCVVLPDKNQLIATLSGEGSENARNLVGGETVSLLMDQEDFGIELFDQRFFIGRCRFYAPQVRAVGANGLLKSLDDGDAAGRQLTIRTVEGTGFWAFSVDRLIGDDTDVVRPVSLGLADFPDAPEVTDMVGEPATMRSLQG